MAVAGVGMRLGGWLAQAGEAATPDLIRQALLASVAEANRTILQASQQAFASVQGLSLFHYL